MSRYLGNGELAGVEGQDGVGGRGSKASTVLPTRRPSHGSRSGCSRHTVAPSEPAAARAAGHRRQRLVSPIDAVTADVGEPAVDPGRRSAPLRRASTGLPPSCRRPVSAGGRRRTLQADRQLPGRQLRPLDHRRRAGPLMQVFDEQAAAAGPARRAPGAAAGAGLEPGDDQRPRQDHNPRSATSCATGAIGTLTTTKPDPDGTDPTSPTAGVLGAEGPTPVVSPESFEWEAHLGLVPPT